MSTEVTNPPEGQIAIFPASRVGSELQEDEPETKHELGWCPVCIKDGQFVRDAAHNIIEWAQRLREEAESESEEMDCALIPGLAFAVEMAAVDVACNVSHQTCNRFPMIPTLRPDEEAS